MAKLTASITGNADTVVDIKVSCIPTVAAAAVNAVEDVGVAISATATVAGASGN